jgi:signal transduction histidine kinase
MFALILRIRERPWLGYGVALLACLAGLALRFALASVISPAPFLTFIPAIVIAALAGGLAPGLFAVVLSAGLANHFFMPAISLSQSWPGARGILLAYVFVSSIIAMLTDIAMTTGIRLDRASTALRIANETLEARIATRTAALVQAEEQLRQAQKMEAIGLLTGGIAHDFNNLLTGISGSLDVLQISCAQGATGDFPRHIATAKDATSRAATLIHRLLAFARRQPLAPSLTDINALATGMADLIARAISPAIELSLQPAPALPPMLVDPNQLEHALLNLCINASDAMPQGGRLTIATGCEALGTEAAALDLPPGDYVTLSVSDTGTGMPPEVLTRAFDPFFTTKPVGQGTGLGLSMIYGFTRQSGGNAIISSTPGQGTRVKLYLPCHASPLAPATSLAATPPRPSPGGTGKAILVVDDEIYVCELIAELLRDEGYTILQAATGAAALELLRTMPGIALLITDIGLPDIGGQDLAAAGRAFLPSLKLLFITGYVETTALGGTPLPPGAYMLTKPFPLMELPPLVQALLAAPDATPILGEIPSAL